MKEKTIYILLLPFGILFLLSFIPQNKYEIENRKQIKELLKKMHFIEGRTFTVGVGVIWRLAENDSTLLSQPNPERPDVNSFYLNATEVTNSEWWEFYSAMEDELGVEKAIELYYPDTQIWEKEFKFSYNATMTSNYFESPDYNDFPVLGISWVQAQAYCKWKTQMLRKVAKGHEELKDLTFRLPTQNEWELAAIGPFEPQKLARHSFPWQNNSDKNDDDYFIQKENKYYANFGIIDEQNGIRIKDLSDDGALYTCAIGSYPPNLYGLYDMAGNVAEWVSDTAMIYDFKKKVHIHNLKDIDAYIEELKDEEHFEFIKSDLFHNREIITRGDMRLIKGGSWRDGLAYLRIASREAMDKNKKSSRVGFRIAVSYEEKYEKYFPKKYWKPKKKKKK